MSYQVIARKYRPQSFADLIGQEHVATSLKNALENQRIPHAILFSGTRGVGKTTTARIFAKSIRCESPVDNNPCNVCNSCKEITNGSSVDVLEIDGASNNGVDAIRELRDSVSYMPSSGSYKIYIIDEVHMLSNSAFNALLKTLEEPPKHVIFMFATTEPQKIPATILSRCQRYDLRKVSSREIADLLLNIAAKEDIQHSGEALWLIAKTGQGSVRDAFSAMDLCISFSNRQLSEENVSEVLGISDRNLRMQVLKSMAAKDKEDLLNIVAQVSAASIDAKVFIQNLLEDLRNLLVIKIGGTTSSKIVDISESEATDLQEIASALSEEEIHMLFDMALKGANDIQQAFEPKVVLEMVFMRMANAPRIHFLYADANLAQTDSVAEKKSLKTPETANAKPPQQKEPAKTVAPKTAPQKPTSPPEKKIETPKPQIKKDIQLLPNAWGEVVAKVTDSNPLLGNKLRNVAIHKVDSDNLVLALDKEHEFMLADLNEKKTGKSLLQTFQEEGFHLKDLKFIVNKAKEEVVSIEKQEKINRAQEEQDIKNKIEASDILKETKRVFKIKSQKIKELT